MKLMSYFFYLLTFLYLLSVMVVIWMPFLVHDGLPEAWIPIEFPESPKEMLPNIVAWLPLPEGRFFLTLIIANSLMVIPGFILKLFADWLYKNKGISS